MSEYKSNNQNNYGWSLTFDAAGRYPVVAKRKFGTLADAQEFVDDASSTATATEGLIISVINDPRPENNGIYFVKEIATGIYEEDGKPRTTGFLVKSDTEYKMIVKQDTSYIRKGVAVESIGLECYIEDNHGRKYNLDSITMFDEETDNTVVVSPNKDNPRNFTLPVNIGSDYVYNHYSYGISANYKGMPFFGDVMLTVTDPVSMLRNIPGVGQQSMLFYYDNLQAVDDWTNVLNLDKLTTEEDEHIRFVIPAPVSMLEDSRGYGLEYRVTAKGYPVSVEIETDPETGSVLDVNNNIILTTGTFKGAVLEDFVIELKYTPQAES